MIYASNIRPCAHFKSLEKGLPFDYIDMHSVNCKDCLYFSSRNCGMDTNSLVNTEMAMFM